MRVLTKSIDSQIMSNWHCRPFLARCDRPSETARVRQQPHFSGLPLAHACHPPALWTTYSTFIILGIPHQPFALSYLYPDISLMDCCCPAPTISQRSAAVDAPLARTLGRNVKSSSPDDPLSHVPRAIHTCSSNQQMYTFTIVHEGRSQASSPPHRDTPTRDQLGYLRSPAAKHMNGLDPPLQLKARIRCCGDVAHIPRSAQAAQLCIQDHPNTSYEGESHTLTGIL